MAISSLRKSLSRAAVVSSLFFLSSCALFSPNKLSGWASPEEVESEKATFPSDSMTLEQQAELFDQDSSRATPQSSRPDSATTAPSSPTASSSMAPIAAAQTAPSAQKVRIALGDARASVTITVPRESEWWSSDKEGKRLEKFQPLVDRGVERDLQITPCDNALCLSSADGVRIKLAANVTLIPSDSLPIAVAGKRHRGELQLQRRGKQLQAILLLPLEEYLRGVVPLEIGKLDLQRIEALKAQAVAARTYTIRHLGQYSAHSFDLFDDTRDQVYGGISAEDSLVNRAIAETAGLILTWKGKPIEAYYHSTCGGHTADISEMWGKEKIPYLSSVSDLDPAGNPWCAGSVYLSWTRTWSWEQLDQIAEQYLATARPKPDISIRRVERVQVIANSSDGRVKTLEVIGNKGMRTEIQGDRTRWLLRDPKQPERILPSSHFTLEAWEKKGVIAKGSGYGHGIGLCQMGARERARRGQSFQEILYAYYPGTQIELWSGDPAQGN